MDITLFYEEKGEGVPLILLHGNGEDMSYFINQFDFLSSSFHVYAIDTRGHGKSPRGERPFTLEVFSDDLYFFMKSKRIDRAILFGFSDGANIAMIFSTLHPEMVLGMILDGGNLFPEGLREDVIGSIRDEYESAKANGDKRKEELFSLMAYEPNIDPKALFAVKCPVLVIAGDEDVVKREHSQLIASSFENGEFVLVSGTHFAALENPEEFNHAISLFLDAHFLTNDKSGMVR